MSLVFALAASPQELPWVEQQDGGAAAKPRGNVFLSVWALHRSFYLWLRPIWNSGRGGEEKARDGCIPTDENSQSSLDGREAKIEMQCAMGAYIAATDVNYFFFFEAGRIIIFPLDLIHLSL